MPCPAQHTAAKITMGKDCTIKSLSLIHIYLKLVKNKPKTKGNDSLDDYDYGEEDSEEWETEDEESEEPLSLIHI